MAKERILTVAHDNTLKTLIAQRDHTRNDIIRRARSMAARLQALASNMEKDPSYRPSDLGELQSDGTIFDNRCGKYWVLCETVALLEG